jgi:hypothetical protein
MNKFSKDLIESLTEAVEHAEGKPTGVRVHVVTVAEALCSSDANFDPPPPPQRSTPRRMG